MTAQVLPSDMYLDSSVIVAAIIGGDPHSAGCTRYCADLATNNSAIYFSELVRLEVAHVIRRLATTNAAPQRLHEQYRLSHFSTNPAVRREWMQFGMAEFETLLRTFFVVYEVPYRKVIWRQALQLMSLHNLRSYDAAHIATALVTGVPDFASVDSDYVRVSGLRVHLIR
ncbi:MAG TPA: PIN domain-containing protein [Thermomicrobiales bacterium]